MELQQALQKRRSVRRFTAQPVSEEHIDVLLHAAMSGPSACNLKPWEFYVVSAPDALARLRAAARYAQIDAPLAVVVCGDLTRTLPQPLSSFWVQDCAAATENLLLAAAALDLGTVWCGIHPQQEAEARVREALGLPETHIPLNIVYVGHPAEQPEPRDQYDAARVHRLA